MRNSTVSVELLTRLIYFAESLRAICEAISVAMEIAELPNIPIAMNVTLDRRRSKLVHSKGSAGLLDISSLPDLTRNVSETQLLALKTVGKLSKWFLKPLK